MRVEVAPGHRSLACDAQGGAGGLRACGRSRQPRRVAQAGGRASGRPPGPRLPSVKIGAGCAALACSEPATVDAIHLGLVKAHRVVGALGDMQGLKCVRVRGPAHGADLLAECAHLEAGGDRTISM